MLEECGAPGVGAWHRRAFRYPVQMGALEVFGKAVMVAEAFGSHLESKFRVAETKDALGGETLLWERRAMHVSGPSGRSIAFYLPRTARIPVMRLPAFGKCSDRGNSS